MKNDMRHDHRYDIRHDMKHGIKHGMKDGVDVGVLVFNELMRDPEIKKMVRGNIHPLLVKQDIKYPFITYQRASLTPVYSKDRLVQDNISLQVDCVSDTYSESVRLASLVRKNLDDVLRSRRLHIRLENAVEETSEYAFIQSLTFSIQINY